jgi:hypothetical protein
MNRKRQMIDELERRISKNKERAQWTEKLIANASDGKQKIMS